MLLQKWWFSLFDLALQSDEVYGNDKTQVNVNFELKFKDLMLIVS